VAGNPATIKKDVTEKMLNWKTKGTALYQALPKELHKTLKECEPLTSPAKFKPKQESLYATWNEIKNS
ncbi:MAG: gamma carbonic anhydrase family protein, partial [Flavobacteriales bacterium]|nr:gamma carbonic anhydrase family protein [Flavobacteriales bacterium]